MVAKPLCPLYKNIIKPLDRARYPELRYGMKEISDPDSDEPHSRQQMHSTEQTSTSKVDKTDKQTEENGK